MGGISRFIHRSSHAKVHDQGVVRLRPMLSCVSARRARPFADRRARRPPMSGMLGLGSSTAVTLRWSATAARRPGSRSMTARPSATWTSGGARSPRRLARPSASTAFLWSRSSPRRSAAAWKRRGSWSRSRRKCDGCGFVRAEPGALRRVAGGSGCLARAGHACAGDARDHRPAARRDHAGTGRDRSGQAQAWRSGCRRGHNLYAR